MALYCVDKITQKDVEVAQRAGVGIFLVNSKDYHKGYDMPSNIYRHVNKEEDYWEKNYFNNSLDEEKHERKR